VLANFTVLRVDSAEVPRENAKPMSESREQRWQRAEMAEERRGERESREERAERNHKAKRGELPSERTPDHNCQMVGRASGSSQ